MAHYKILILLPVLLSAVAAVYAAGVVDESDDLLIQQVVSNNDDPTLSVDHHFSSFKEKYGKSYTSPEEHDYRFGVFKANLRRAKRHQKLDPSAVHGVSQFSDLTPAEFRSLYLGLRSLKLPNDAKEAPILPTNHLPADLVY